MPSRTDGVIDSMTLDFFTFMADAHVEPKTTLHFPAELQGLQYLEDSGSVISLLDL